METQKTGNSPRSERIETSRLRASGARVSHQDSGNDKRSVLGRKTAGAARRILKSANFGKNGLNTRLCALQRRRVRTKRAQRWSTNSLVGTEGTKVSKNVDETIRKVDTGGTRLDGRLRASTL